MNCRRAERLLCLDSGGELDARQRRAVASHFVVCSSCRIFRDDLGEALQAARSLEVSELKLSGAELRRSVWRKITKERESRKVRKGPAFRRWVFGTAAAAAAAIVAGVFFLPHPHDGGLSADSRLVRARALPAILPSRLADAAPPAAEQSPLAEDLRPGRVAQPRGHSEAGITRIEFRARESGIRVIWLVGQEAAEVSPAPSPDPKQEVS